MVNDNFMTLFNLGGNQEKLLFELRTKADFNLNIESVSEVVGERNRLLNDKGLIELSLNSLIKSSEILFETPGMSEKHWQKELPLFLEIFYELRQINQFFIDDETIIELIGNKYHDYDEDFNKVAAYFETNFDLEKRLS